MDIKKKTIVYLHIGMNKTGTSALQRHFSFNRENYLANGLLYPLAGRNNTDAHYALSDLLGFSIDPKFNLQDHRKKLSCIKEALNNEIISSGAQSILLSSEFFILNKDLSPVIEFFQDYTVKVIVYLRRHDYWWVSGYGQGVKTKSMPPWGRGPIGFINYNKNKNKMYGKYRYLVDRWANLFGSENIIVQTYEDQQKEWDLITDFLCIIEGPFNLIRENEENRRDNEALPIQAIQYLDIFQRVATDECTRDKLLTFARGVDKGSLTYLIDMLNPAFRRRLIEENIADYEYIARKYKGRENGVLFSEQLPRLNLDWKAPKWPTQQKVAENVINILK